jgi:prepilin-type N-terminal cleavage/methylation domain-containing protein
MSMLKKHLKQDGLTLIEVLVSIVILSIILTTFFSFFSQSLVFSGKNEEKLVAYNLASKTLRVVEEKYKNTLQTDLNIISSSVLCTENFSITEIRTTITSTSICYFNENQKNYYPEVLITKELNHSTDFSTSKIVLYKINVKIYDKQTTPRKLLSETFGYIRGKST